MNERDRGESEECVKKKWRVRRVVREKEEGKKREEGMEREGQDGVSECEMLKITFFAPY